MNRLVNTISGRMSLRPPQRESLEVLDRITEIIPLEKNTNLQSALDTISSEYPSVTDFERSFPSLCFALATGVGKTRLMGAFISYLYLAHGKRNFMVLAPNLTIYNKLITDFTPNTPKYVFKGIAEFAQQAPVIITGDDYETGVGVRDEYQADLRGQRVLFQDVGPVHINIFNISKINSEVRGGKSPRIKRLSEYIGQSYFDYLAGLPDLVLLMDESHRYRASAGARAINELNPIIGLELTATPYVESNKGPILFNNIIVDYNLARAMEDGYVKEPVVATQKNFFAGNYTQDQIEEIKLKDGVRLHENTKVELKTYHNETGKPLVKPFMLVIARDTTHAAKLLKLIQSDQFFDGSYKDKVIQVDSSQTGAKEDEMISRLLAVEKEDEPTEIVIHVNMLKEGWDVTNLYTIVPLRAANARVLIEQSIGRGLRLPYGKRTGRPDLDRLIIVAHDKFQEIVDEANRPDSPVHMKTVILEQSDLTKKKTVVSKSRIASMVYPSDGETPNQNPIFNNKAEQDIAKLVYDRIVEHEKLSSSQRLLEPAVQNRIAERTAEYMTSGEPEIPDLVEKPDIQEIVKKVTSLYVKNTIDIPRIIVMPKGDATTGFKPFVLDCSSISYQPVEHDILMQELRTQKRTVVALQYGDHREERLQDYLVRGLMNFNDICYDEHAGLLYDLAGQMVEHLQGYLSDEEDVINVLQYHQKQLVNYIHSEMIKHQWDQVTQYEITVSKGYTELKQSAYTIRAEDAILDFHEPVAEKSQIKQMIFGGFKRCLYDCQKFDSDSERRLAVILDRESQKWFRPVKGQFQIFYKLGLDPQEYVPDFVAETDDTIYMLEPKASNMIDTDEVKAKKEAGEKWCERATAYSVSQDGKPWKYALIRHDAISDAMTIEGLVREKA